MVEYLSSQSGDCISFQIPLCVCVCVYVRVCVCVWVCVCVCAAFTACISVVMGQNYIKFVGKVWP